MERERYGTLVSLARRMEVPANDGVCGAEVFHALLRHERARVDRDGSEFSLVVFSIEGNPSLTRSIRKAMRSIDEVGRIDGSTIGVLLPATALAGGMTFGRRVMDSLDFVLGEQPFRVYAYPHHWLPRLGEDRVGEPGTDGAPAEGRDKDGPSLRECRSALPEVLERVFSKPIPEWKRVLDVSGAVLGLLVLSPLFFLISLYIKLMSPGPILFRHQRVGMRGRTFTFLKFRTMRWGNNQNAHKDHIVAAIRAGGALEKLDDKGDSRIIPGGRILRKTCLDELPQLINVLRGEMSLVGPRPCMPYEADEFLRWHTHRFDVLPGMTGLWQISGKNKLTFCQMVRLDISYGEHLSLWRDIRIILLTLPAIARMVFEAVAGKISGRPSQETAARPVNVADCQGRTS